MLLLADDLGWANVGWHNVDDPEVRTPHMDSLVSNGISLDHHYAYKFCSPSRSALQTGRNPIHVNVQNLGPRNHNPRDPISGFSGIPRNMTGIAELLRAKGYRTHMAGKWDAGMATRDHSPLGRGYDTSLFYFHHMNDYWTFYYDGFERTWACGDAAPTDLFANAAPARSHVNPSNCSVGRHGQFCAVEHEAQCLPYPGYPGPLTPGCEFEDVLFSNSVIEFLEAHAARARYPGGTLRPRDEAKGASVPADGSTPFFVYWAPHIAHAPLQVPPAHLARFAFIPDWRRRRYAAMVSYLDDEIERVGGVLRATRQWDSTLIAFSSDNGGSVVANGGPGANNFPLRGGKMSNWEGGVRVPAFVSGGFVPSSRRGLRLSGLVALWDWYTTFATLGGVTNATEDPKAAAARLPPVDGLDLWPYLSGRAARSPRVELPLGSSVLANGSLDLYGEGDPLGNGTRSFTVVGGLLMYDGGELWKLLYEDVAMSGWQGPRFPNGSTTTDFVRSVEPCGGGRGHGGCLFRLDADPTEHHDVAHLHPHRVASMLAALKRHNATVFSPDRGPWDPNACVAAMGKWGGFWGPWLE